MVSEKTDFPEGTQVRVREDRLDGFIREARLKMDRGRVGEVKRGGYGHGAGTVWVSFPAVGRRKPYKQRLDVRDLEVVSPAPEPTPPTKRPSM